MKTVTTKKAFGTRRLMSNITHNTGDIKNKLTFLTTAKKLGVSKFYEYLQ